MGSKNVRKLKGKKQRAIYLHHLVRDIEALELMIQRDMFEKSPIRIGAEQEFCIVDSEFLPHSKSLQVLEEINDRHFTTEIGNYNLEINSDPIPLGRDCFSVLHRDLDDLMGKAKSAAQKFGSRIIITGILPTIASKHTTLESMTAVDRYFVLNEAAKEYRGQDFSIHIKGVDEVTMLHDSVMLEGCNTSFQMHLQLDPEEFVEMFNWSQAITGPVLAACSNSPLLFGKELWSETRIALFTQSVDVRTNSFFLNENQPRVSFESKWQTGTISDVFKDNIARFRSILTADFESDSVDLVEKGEIPLLKALCLHNGTVYRWNRACFGVGDGKPHLRIECRYLPSGPTVIDQIANMAFWVGLMKGRPEKYKELHLMMDFKEVKSNFLAAARYGMAVQFHWEGKLYSAQKLLSEVFLPIARDGLTKVGISEGDIEKYLSVIQNRINTHNGSEWITKSYRNLLITKKPDAAVQVLTANLYLNQESKKPVSEWEVLPPEAMSQFNITKKVHHVMSTDIFSVEEKDSIELVAHMMKWKNIHHMPVIKGDKELLGILSWVDVQLLFENGNATQATVKSLMKTELITIGQDSTVDEAKELMDRHKIHALPVVRENKLIGILTSNDL
ncbi:CBS domain-containing protein [Aquiflexum sp. LQ15W]|uniref:CBS domain-containing protein n=1 Tax=Cognataquiflexum nitidum TaxID=2922272 RepID=UPI001F1324C9|nr:CBS domain-containing protein [Cognataquiflexum nitidum]MCH6200453.1 CBS domain-containing protein [Cognataquiflexum nitidum]